MEHLDGEKTQLHLLVWNAAFPDGCAGPSECVPAVAGLVGHVLDDRIARRGARTRSSANVHRCPLEAGLWISTTEPKEQVMHSHPTKQTLPRTAVAGACTCAAIAILAVAPARSEATADRTREVPLSRQCFMEQAHWNTALDGPVPRCPGPSRETRSGPAREVPFSRQCFLEQEHWNAALDGAVPRCPGPPASIG